jgi:hypothetical protein
MKNAKKSLEMLPQVQRFAFGGIANPSQRAYLGSADRAYLEARQREAQAYEREAAQYNEAVARHNAALEAGTAGEFTAKAPTVPFKEEEFKRFEQDAVTRARKAAGNRATAINVVSNPDQFGFGSMSIADRFMSEGGEVSADDDEDEKGVGEVGSAQELLAQLEGRGPRSEKKAAPALKRMAVGGRDGASMPKGMGMEQEPLGSVRELVAMAKDKGSARQQMEELARLYQLRAATFNQPTLSGPTMSKNTLATKRFKEGGEVMDPEAALFEGRGDVPVRRDEVAEMLEAARKDRLYQDLEQYLQSRDEMPSIRVGRTAPYDGTFTSDNLNIGSGSIKVDKNMRERERPSALVHEMTHAADRQIKQQAMEQGMFGKNNQLTEAYKKLVGPEGRNRTEVVRRMYPEYARDYSDYRTTPKEIAAFGVSAFAKNPSRGFAPEHLDATAAQEFMILLDLAQRNVDKGPKGLSKIPAALRKLGRYAEGGEVMDPEAALFAGRGDVPAKPKMTGRELAQQALYGAGDLPYVMAGAPVDLAAMVMAPFGYKDDKPFMGSADIKARMTRAGIRPADTTEPRLQGPRMASEMLASLTNPAAVARKVGPVVEKGVKAGAMEVGRQLDRAIMDNAGPLAKVIPQAAKPLYISRSPGGYFPTSRVEGGILSKLDEAFDPVLKKAREVEDPEKREALTMLFNQKAKDFYTKQAGSVQDPLRQDILAGNLKFELGTDMGDKFPRFTQKSAAQGDLEALRQLEKNYDEMVGIKSVVPRRQGTGVIDNVVESQIIANMQANLDKIPDAQLVAYSGKKPADIPAQAAEIRQKIKDNPTLFSTILEPRIAKTLFPESRYYTDSDMARYPEMYGGAAAAAMRVRGKRTPEYGEEVSPGFFLPEMEAAIDKGQPIMDVRSPRMLGMDPEKMLVEAQKMPTQELSQMSFPDFLKKAYANTQALDQFEKQIPKVKKMIQDGKAPPADVMTYGVKDFLPMPDKTFRWVKVVKPDAVKAIAAGMDNSVASYANSTVYGALRKGRAALESGEAEVYALYDKNNVPHMTMEYLTSKPGVPDDQKNTIAQLTGNGPLTKNEVPEKYASQIVELLNRIQPNRVPPNIKRLLEETGQKAFLTDEAMAPLYFGVPLKMLRAGEDDLLQQLGAP